MMNCENRSDLNSDSETTNFCHSSVCFAFIPALRSMSLPPLVYSSPFKLLRKSDIKSRLDLLCLTTIFHPSVAEITLSFK